MPGWQQALAHVVNNVDEHFDTLKYRLARRLGGGNDPLMICCYNGFGTSTRLRLRGRVLEDEGVRSALDDDTLWDNLLNMYRRFESDEAPYARVVARFQGAEQLVTANQEGFFEVSLEPPSPLPSGQLWQSIEVELVSPKRAGQPPIRVVGQVLIPPPGARYGVISDIDDTVVQTDATSLLKMARTVFLGNARTRLPFEGVAGFYRALHAGASGHDANPLFYLSSSPWNLYDLLVDFFHLQSMPLEPVLFLRDWGVSKEELLPKGHRAYKLGSIHQIMSAYPDLPFILIGDSGQEDPEIYQEVVSIYGKRVLAVYIRNVSRDLKRPQAIQTLAEKVLAAGSTLILADNTLPLAEHAIAQGWIAPEALSQVVAEKRKDEAPPRPLETLLGQAPQDPGPQVAVEAPPAGAQSAVADGAVEEALQAGDPKREKPPTVIVRESVDESADEEADADRDDGLANAEKS